MKYHYRVICITGKPAIYELAKGTKSYCEGFLEGFSYKNYRESICIQRSDGKILKGLKGNCETESGILGFKAKKPR